MTPPFWFFKENFKSMMSLFYNCLSSWIVRYSCFMLDIPTLKKNLSRMGKVSMAIINFNLLRPS